MPVTITLSDDEALVLFEYAITAANETGRLLPGEQTALWVLEGRLESNLLAPLQKDYASRLDQARTSLSQRNPTEQEPGATVRGLRCFYDTVALAKTLNEEVKTAWDANRHLSIAYLLGHNLDEYVYDLLVRIPQDSGHASIWGRSVVAAVCTQGRKSCEFLRRTGIAPLGPHTRFMLSVLEKKHHRMLEQLSTSPECPAQLRRDLFGPVDDVRRELAERMWQGIRLSISAGQRKRSGEGNAPDFGLTKGFGGLLYHASWVRLLSVARQCDLMPPELAWTLPVGAMGIPD